MSPGIENDWRVLAQTIFGESRSESLQGQIAVAWVARNRADKPGWWGGPSVESVCRKPYQFSCWLDSDPNRPIMEAATVEDPHFLVALGVSALVMQRQLPDPTHGATHYVADYIEPPAWTKDLVPTVKIGVHQFYREP